MTTNLHTVTRAVDPRKLARRSTYITVDIQKGKDTVSTVVSVPEPEAPAPVEPPVQETATRHTEIQYQLLQLGIDLGLDTWVARNDRTKSYKGVVLGKLPRILDALPTERLRALGCPS